MTVRGTYHQVVSYADPNILRLFYASTTATAVAGGVTLWRCSSVRPGLVKAISQENFGLKNEAIAFWSSKVFVLLLNMFLAIT